MKLKRVGADGNGATSEAEITTRHPRSREGVPILVVDGEPVAVVDASEAGFEIVAATDAERSALSAGGYRLPEAGDSNPE